MQIWWITKVVVPKLLLFILKGLDIMQIADMVSKIIKTETVPIHMYDLKFFSSVTYLKPNSDKQRGLYLPNCDSLETLESARWFFENKRDDMYKMCV